MADTSSIPPAVLFDIDETRTYNANLQFAAGITADRAPFGVVPWQQVFRRHRPRYGSHTRDL